MNIHETSKSALFLMELIIIMLFFSLAAGVCANLFVSANTTADKGTDLSMSTLYAQSALECAKMENGDAAEIARLLGGEIDGSGVFLYYDAQWLQTSSQNAQYRLHVTTSKYDKLMTIQVIVTNQNEQIFELSTKRYVAGMI